MTNLQSDVSRPTTQTHNGKVALTLSDLNKLLWQLEVDFTDNVNIKEVHLGKEVLHPNKKGKNRLELNFLQKLGNLWWSKEHLNETYDKGCNLNRSFEDELENWNNSLNSVSSSIYPDREFDGISFETLYELRKSNSLLAT